MSDQARLARLVTAHGFRNILGRIYQNPLYRWRFGGAVPERLVIAPQDIRTTDPTIASDIYAGLFVFSGQAVETGGQSPFEVTPPSNAWARALHGFGWLRHMRAAERAISRSNARSLVEDWIRLHGVYNPMSWQPDITSRRILSWLSQAPLILEEADRAFYRRFLKSLSRQVRYLRHASVLLPDGLPRAQAAIALTAAGLAMSNQGRLLRQSSRWLDKELTRQVLADGGHISRNPGAILELLIDLLPLRQAFAAIGSDPPRALMTAIDRMMPMMRFFRHSDGALAHFNGMGATRSDLVATVFAHDDARGSPVLNAPHSGYQRLQAGEAVMIVDTGAPPPPMASGQAHAGCLSFEMSTGGAQIVVNCGVPPETQPDWRLVARATAAHSTAVLNDTSSCHFVTGRFAEGQLGSIILSGPEEVPVSREDSQHGETLVASHDGYLARFGIRHERRLVLAPDGRRLAGIDAFHGTSGGAVRGGKDAFSLRFHLHPSVQARPRLERDVVVLILDNGETWHFSSPGSEIEIEESVYLSDIHGHRRSSQLVIYGKAAQRSSVAWSLYRVAD
ncbi:MAG: heparinase II/III family protein [Hyphomicrobiales bacterium]